MQRNVICSRRTRPIARGSTVLGFGESAQNPQENSHRGEYSPCSLYICEQVFSGKIHTSSKNRTAEQPHTFSLFRGLPPHSAHSTAAARKNLRYPCPVNSLLQRPRKLRIVTSTHWLGPKTQDMQDMRLLWAAAAIHHPPAASSPQPSGFPSLFAIVLAGQVAKIATTFFSLVLDMHASAIP